MEQLSQNQPIYLAGKKTCVVNKDTGKKKDIGSGYAFIGLPKDVPKEYLEAEVIDTWVHDTAYPGTAVKIDYEVRKEGKWFWWEFDESIPDATHTPLECQDANLMMCYTAIIKLLISNYTIELKARIASKRLKNPESIRNEIERVRKTFDLSFIKGNSTGQYTIQRAEDEVFILATHRELNKVHDTEKKNALIEKYRKEILAERVKKAGEGRYATWTRIKNGKKITHSVTGTVTERKEDT
jgi:hypothetical protein